MNIAMLPRNPRLSSHQRLAAAAKERGRMIQVIGRPKVYMNITSKRPPIGYQGETHSAAKSTIEAFRGAQHTIPVQEFIKEADVVDISCFVISGKVVGSMTRRGAPDEFSSNLHRSGSAERVRITPEERSTAVRAARMLGLKVAGVDLLRSNHGPVVKEISSSPGLEGIEKATKLDLAGMVAGFLEKNAKPDRTKTHGQC